MTHQTPKRPEETHPERRARHFAILRELADLNMIAARDAAARDAAARIQTATSDTPDAAIATLALARASRAVTSVINLENRIANGETVEPRRAHDPRRETLRKTLAALVRDPDPAHRAALRRDIDAAVDDAIDLDLDDDIPLGQIADIIANDLGLSLDIATLPDELLGFPPKPHPQPGEPTSDFGETFARAPP